MGVMSPDFPENNLKEDWYNQTTPSSRGANRYLQVSTLYRAGLEGVDTDMAQPFHSMAPLPPHLKYKPVISTYMDHFRKPKVVLPKTRRNFLQNAFLKKMREQQQPPQLPQPGTMTSSQLFQRRPGTKKPKINGYMQEMYKSTTNSMAPYDARTDVPYKQTTTTKTQRELLKKIGRDGYNAMGEVEARNEARKDRSVNFYDQHRVHSAPAAKNPAIHPRATPPRQATPPQMERPKRAKTSLEPHWMAWQSGTPEPPGLQRRLHKPWPSPEPPMERPVSRASSVHVSRPVSCCLQHQNNPVPDAIGSSGTHPELMGKNEEVFTPGPPERASNPMPYFM